MAAKLSGLIINLTLLVLVTSAPISNIKDESPKLITEDIQNVETTKELPSDEETNEQGNRQAKSLSFYDFPPQFFQQDEFNDALGYDNEEEDLSRAIPSRKRFQGGNNLPFSNSPIYYIRLPATPYMFVPGLGYVSNPPSLNPLGAPASVPVANPFINLPLNFMSNGKPTNIYQWAGVPQSSYQQQQNTFQQQQNGFQQQQNGYQQQPNGYQQQNMYQQQNFGQNYPSQQNYNPQNNYGYDSNDILSGSYQKPNYNAQNDISNNVYTQKPIKKPIKNNYDGKITNLKGSFAFNGKPTNIMVLRDSYNALYSDALTNFYP